MTFSGRPWQPRHIKYQLKNFMICSGFPEPLFWGSAKKASRWSRFRLEQLVREGKPWMLVECKSQSTALSGVLKKFAAQFPSAMAFQLTTSDVDRIVPGYNIRIMNVEKFLSMFIWWLCKKSEFVMLDLIRHPELVEITGFPFSWEWL